MPVNSCRPGDIVHRFSPDGTRMRTCCVNCRAHTGYYSVARRAKTFDDVHCLGDNRKRKPVNLPDIWAGGHRG